MHCLMFDSGVKLNYLQQQLNSTHKKCLREQPGYFCVFETWF